MLLKDKRVLVTGVLTESSIAYHVASLAIQQGAQLVLTGYGRGLPITCAMAEQLPRPCDVLEMDVTRQDHLDKVADDLDRRWGSLDGVVHGVAFAPRATLGGGFLSASWDDVATALHVSTYSFAAFGRTFGALLGKADAGTLIGLDFDATKAWPGYGWMGVAKAGLESCCRYLASELGQQGTRVNLVAAGPLRTMAAKAIPSFASFERAWIRRAPLGWDAADAEPVARVVCALMSDWMPAVTGEIVHVDGGMHAVGVGAHGDGNAVPG